MPSVEASLQALKADYVDVLLLHWPALQVIIVKRWSYCKLRIEDMRG